MANKQTDQRSVCLLILYIDIKAGTTSAGLTFIGAPILMGHGGLKK